MIKSIEATGKTKDDALASALRTLGLTADDVTYEVLDMGKAGFFGFGAQPARIKVSYEVPGQEPEEPGHNLDLASVAALLAAVALCVELRVHDILVNVL